MPYPNSCFSTALQDDVLWFQVAMNNLHLIQSFEAGQQVHCDLLHQIGREALMIPTLYHLKKGYAGNNKKMAKKLVECCVIKALVNTYQLMK